jgi:energy-coupling factor transport system ATP-binding protein
MSVLIECHNISVAFATQGEPVFALRDVSLTIRQGEWVALVGRNGSGKSTLGRVLAGLCPVSKGTVRRTLPESPTRLGVAVVFQNPDAQIVGQTVYEDVCFGLENLGVPEAELHSRAMQALSRVGLLAKRDHRVETLSGGQKQLLCIASALALEPAVMVFDEATSMQNPGARAAILDVVRHLHRTGMTVVWITQWMSELAFADRVVALEDGRLVFDGSVPAFFYAEQPGAPSPCETLGFEAPFAVQVATRLRGRGLFPDARPVTPEDLAAVVSGR